ncbi:hypothetical protein MRX96_045952 [Rhipicephalus microplus]
MPGLKIPQSQRSKTFFPKALWIPDTALVLVNAIYFKGLWKDQFNPEATSLEEFHTSKESSKEVHMMYKQSRFGINTECTGLNANAVEIPYKGGKTSMVILLPHEVEGLSELEAALTPSKLSDILLGLRSKTVALSLPRFRIEHSINLKKILHAMGDKRFVHQQGRPLGHEWKKRPHTFIGSSQGLCRGERRKEQRRLLLRQCRSG